MKQIERFLCYDCRKNLDEAHLVYKELPSSRDTAKCDWCRRMRYGAYYRIRYGKEGN